MIFEKQILKVYRKMAFCRCDDTDRVFYFSPEDFPGLLCEPFSFPSSLGHTLQGFFYSYPEACEGRLIVFDHGFGGGHRAYIKEIELLARAGYTVFAYDHTGCMASGGEHTNGMAQSLHDLDDCICALKKSERARGLALSVVGHSWGGFSTLNISALHPEITHAVVLSGFVSVRLLVESYFSGILKGYRKAILALEEKANPDYIHIDARESLKGSKTRALLIYSDNDKRCDPRVHYKALTEALSGEDRIRFRLEGGKGHNPNYTKDAVAYLDTFFADLAKRTKTGELASKEACEGFVSSYDWERMTAQDMDVWEEIFAFLKS